MRKAPEAGTGQPALSHHSTLCSDMNHKPSLVSLKPPTFQLWKNVSETLIPHKKTHLLCTNTHNNLWRTGSNQSSPLLKLTIRFGSRQETLNETSWIWKSHQNEKDPLPSPKSYHPYPTNLNSPPCGKFTLFSTHPSSHPIMRMKSMDRISQLHPWILLIMKKNTKLNGY